MKPSVSRLNSGITPWIRLPLIAGGSGATPRVAGLIGRSSALITAIGPMKNHSLQKVCINARFAIGDHNRSESFFVKPNRPGAADDSVNVAHLSQTPEACKQQRFSDAATLHTINHTCWSKEASARALVGCKTNDFFFSGRDIDSDGLVCKTN